MATIKKSEIKQIISEEIARAKNIKSLEAKKKMLEEAIKKMEEGEELDELSFQGIKNALNLGGKKVGDAASAAGQKVGATAEKFGSAVASKVDDAVKKFKTGYVNLENGLKELGKEFDTAMTKGDVDALQNKVTNVFADLQVIVDKLNEKRKKLGMKPVTILGLLNTARAKAKSAGLSNSASVVAENKKSIKK
jgi:DNA repair exonuclease SbcCD ATPase subunit